MKNNITAVEWYNAKLNAIDFKLNSGLINYEQCTVEMSEAFEQAKAMEKEQIIEAYTNALTGSIDPRWVEIHKKQAEQYYNETFKSE